MHKTETLKQNTKNSTRYLTLVHGSYGGAGSAIEFNSHSFYVEARSIRFLTSALMNRLLIQPSNSIVGLLDVGITKDNFDEVYKWINEQLKYSTSEHADSALPRLERNFRKAISNFPEI